MALDLEWRKRIDRYRDEFPAHLYRPLGDVELEGFVTSEKLTVQQAARREFLPMPAGTAWGGKWQYGWFRARIELPKASAGQRVVFQGKPGGESLVYINGRVSGSGGWARKTVLLSRDANPGDAFELLLESYAGHGPRVCGGGPVRPEVSSVPEPPPTQQIVEASSFGIWDELAYQLWVDFETLVRLRDSLDERSLRVSRIDDALREASCVIDFELPQARRHATFAAARKLLGPHSGTGLTEDFLRENAPPGSLAFLLDPGRKGTGGTSFRERLEAQAVAAAENIFRSEADLVAGCRRFKGLGSGLTPAGDDFVAGVLAALGVLERLDGIDRTGLKGEIAAAARGANPLVNSFISLTAGGWFFERLKNLLDGLAGDEPAEVRQRAGELIAFGASSGSDLAMGLLLTLKNCRAGFFPV